MNEFTGMGDRTILAPGASPLTRQTRHAGISITGHRVMDPANPMDESLPCTHTSIGCNFESNGGEKSECRMVSADHMNHPMAQLSPFRSNPPASGNNTDRRPRNERLGFNLSPRRNS